MSLSQYAHHWQSPLKPTLAGIRDAQVGLGNSFSSCNAFCCLSPTHFSFLACGLCLLDSLCGFSCSPFSATAFSRESLSFVYGCWNPLTSWLFKRILYPVISIASLLYTDIIKWHHKTIHSLPHPLSFVIGGRRSKCNICQNLWSLEYLSFNFF